MNDGVDDTMVVNIAELTMIHACKPYRVDDDTMLVNTVELTMAHASKHCRFDDDTMPVNIVEVMIKCLQTLQS
jgi:hypothetical protein